MIQDVARRTDDSKLTDWYFGIDKKLFIGIIVLVFIGMFAALSTGSAMSVRKDWNWYHFFMSMLPFYFLGGIALIGGSMLDKKKILWGSIINVVGCFLLIGVTAFQSNVINGSSRWIVFAGHSFMPSDIMKPGFIILTAWFLSKMKDKYGDDIFTKKDVWQLNWLSWWTYIVLFALLIVLLFKQPDIGTSILYCSIVGVMLIVAGLPRRFIFCGISLVGIGLVVAFLFQPHVHKRVLQFVSGELEEKSQVWYSINAIRQGGLFGMGEKAFAAEQLPMAESDFVYSALVEDVGAIMACFLLGALVYVIQRLVKNAISARDKFVFYAVSGTFALFSVQVCMNLGTALHLMPPKGMTLPFISFGGSSFLAFSLLFGIILAIIREDKWK